MPSSATTVFEKVLLYDGTGNAESDYSQWEIEAQSVGGTAFNGIANAPNATNCYLMLGSTEKFDAAYFDVQTAGGYTNIVWEYYIGSDTWKRIVPRSAAYERDANSTPEYYSFKKDGMEEFPINQMADWAVYNAGTFGNYYYIRASTTVAPTAIATINQIIKRPLNTYCTTQDVFELMQLKNVTNTADFTTATVPTKMTVEDYIASAEARIEYRTRKQWRIHYVADEYHEFNLNGFKPRYGNMRKLLGLEIWSGSNWESKVIGRKEDFFYVPDTGMIHFSRFFILPARFASYTAPVWRWGGGEFTVPVKIEYLAGRDLYEDAREGGLVYDAARKLAAADIVRSADYGNLAVSGMDRVMLAQRADAWVMEAEEHMDNLRSFEVF